MCHTYVKEKIKVLTHEHADAVLGLDDVREMQKFSVDWRYVTKSTRKKRKEPEYWREYTDLGRNALCG